MNNLIGRKKECERLEKCMKATTAQLVVVYGADVIIGLNQEKLSK